LKKSNYILLCGLLSITFLALAGCSSKNTNQVNELMVTPTAIITPVPSMTGTPSPIVALTTWDEERVYAFLNEIQQYIREIPLETISKEQIIEKYERYFTLELSEKIFDSLYIKTDNGWKVPDGDGGYIFIIPDGKSQGSKVKLEFNKDFIRIRETYEIGMNSAIEYTIHYIDKPVITEWKIE
jgi:hypothetical protein